MRDIEDTEEALNSYTGDSLNFWEEKQRELITSVVDYNLTTLKDLIAGKEIDLSPKYQRRYRWDNDRKSRLIESLLMNVPVPPVFLNEDDYGSYSIIDGKQRLSAIYEYMTNQFELKNLEVFADLNGFRFNELPNTLQRVLRTRPTLRGIIILRQSDQDIKYEVFHRLNTGGVSLNPQEIRNNLFPGSLNDLIMELSILPEFHNLLRIKNKERSSIYKGMRDAEFVLRFLTFKDSWSSFSGGMKRHMDEFMKENRNADEKTLNEYKNDFLRTLKIMNNAFGDKSLRRWQSDRKAWRKQILAALFDAQMIACYQFKAEEFEGKTEQISQQLPVFFESENFSKSIQGATNTPSYVQTRIEETIQFLKSFV